MKRHCRKGRNFARVGFPWLWMLYTSQGAIRGNGGFEYYARIVYQLSRFIFDSPFNALDFSSKYSGLDVANIRSSLRGDVL